MKRSRAPAVGRAESAAEPRRRTESGAPDADQTLLQCIGELALVDAAASTNALLANDAKQVLVEHMLPRKTLVQLLCNILFASSAHGRRGRGDAAQRIDAALERLAQAPAASLAVSLVDGATRVRIIGHVDSAGASSQSDAAHLERAAADSLLKLARPGSKRRDNAVSVRVGKALRSFAFCALESLESSCLPVARARAFQLSLQSLVEAGRARIDDESGIITLTPEPATPSPAPGDDDDAGFELDTSPLPWTPACNALLPPSLFDPPLILAAADALLARSRPASQVIAARLGCEPEAPIVRLADALRALDQFLEPIVAFMPPRSVATRAILARLEQAAAVVVLATHHGVGRQDLHLRLQRIATLPLDLPDPPVSLAAIRAPFDVPGCCAGDAMVARYSRAAWGSLQAPKMRSLPATLHSLVFFLKRTERASTIGEQSGPAESAFESDRWVVAEFAVWRTWQLGTLNAHVEPGRNLRNGSVKRSPTRPLTADLEGIAQRLRASPFGGAELDPRDLLLEAIQSERDAR